MRRVAVGWSEFLVGANRFWKGESPFPGPIAFVDAEVSSPEPAELCLPPCPVIGFGRGDAPLAAWVDAMIELPVTADALADAVIERPLAAMAVVDLLRLLPSLDPQNGLVAESLAYAMLQGSDEHREWQAARSSAKTGTQPPGHVEVARDGAVLNLTFDRAEAGNAIDRPMRDGLYDALMIASLDPGIERVRLTANGKAFSLGADLSEFGTTGDPATAHSIRRRTLPARMAAACADKLEVHVQGACVGAGLEIAMFARRITATPTAWFQLPELSMGILPGAGGCVSLVRRIGRQRAVLMILSGKRLSARQALGWGLIDAIVDHAP